MLMGDGEPNCSCAGAQIHHYRYVTALDLGQNRVDDDFGLRPRHEHSGSDLQVEVTEAGRANQMLQGHTLCALTDELVEVALGLRGVPLKRPRVVFGTRDACLAQQGDSFVHVHSVPLSAAAVSASMSACTTASRSPSSTWSRL